MSLDLQKTAAQLDRFTPQLKDQRAAQALAMAAAQHAFREADAQALETKRQEGRHTWLAAGLDGQLAVAHPPPLLSGDYAVAATDGSHIDVDRHAPARTSLINIGHVLLRYGELADAQLWSTPILYVDEAELVLRDPASHLREQKVEGPLLGLKRTVLELAALADLIDTLPPELPVLALVDGSLIMWGLVTQGYLDFVRQELLENGLLSVLERLRAQAQRRTLAVAGYISLPGSTEVVSALRLHVCPYTPVDCDRHCRTVSAGDRPCDAVAGPYDRDLFGATLAPGQRSATYRSLSSVVTDHYGDHQVRFFYLHVGEEIARVEMPAWCASQAEAVNFAHAALLAQADKGHGYPVALSEAHEQAVVTGQDRASFQLLVEQTLADERLPVFTSQKARSKRTRYV